MNEFLTIALVTCISPAILAVVMWILAKHTRESEWARQDEIAARVDAVKSDLASTTEATTTKLDEIGANVDKVHILVNNNLTTVTKSALAGHVGWLAALEAASAPPTEIADVRRLIADIRSNLADRAVQQEEVDQMPPPPGG